MVSSVIPRNSRSVEGPFVFSSDSGTPSSEKTDFRVDNPPEVTWEGMKPGNCQEERESNIGLCGVGPTVWGCFCNQMLA